MKEIITFLIMWFVFVVIGFVVSVLMHIDLTAAQGVRIWFEHDIIYALIIGWILSGLILFLMYVKSLSLKKK